MKTGSGSCPDADGHREDRERGHQARERHRQGVRRRRQSMRRHPHQRGAAGRTRLARRLPELREQRQPGLQRRDRRLRRHRRLHRLRRRGCGRSGGRALLRKPAAELPRLGAQQVPAGDRQERSAKFVLAKEKSIQKCWDARMTGKHGGTCPDALARGRESRRRRPALAIAKADAQEDHHHLQGVRRHRQALRRRHHRARRQHHRRQRRERRPPAGGHRLSRHLPDGTDPGRRVLRSAGRDPRRSRRVRRLRERVQGRLHGSRARAGVRRLPVLVQPVRPDQPQPSPTSAIRN